MLSPVTYRGVVSVCMAYACELCHTALLQAAMLTVDAHAVHVHCDARSWCFCTHVVAASWLCEGTLWAQRVARTGLVVFQWCVLARCTALSASTFSAHMQPCILLYIRACVQICGCTNNCCTAVYTRMSGGTVVAAECTLCMLHATRRATHIEPQWHGLSCLIYGVRHSVMRTVRQWQCRP